MYVSVSGGGCGGVLTRLIASPLCDNKCEIRKAREMMKAKRMTQIHGKLRSSDHLLLFVLLYPASQHHTTSHQNHTTSH